MTKLTFNRSPYFDDYDSSKNFHKVLFKPKKAIQVRELNQLQTMINDQNETLSNHLFKFGSSTDAGSIQVKNFEKYVRLKDLNPDGSSIDITRLVGRELKGKTSGLNATIIHSIGKDSFDPATVYVNYTNTAIDGVTSKFLNGEVIDVLDDNGVVIYTVQVRCPDCEGALQDSDTIDPTGFGSLFYSDASTYYIHGFYVDTPYQVIALEKYKTDPSFKIGFDIVQQVVNASDDSTLYDNALGTPNLTAEGADRYKIQLVLVKKLLTDSLSDESFVKLAVIDSGTVLEIKDKPQYADILNMLAERTYDESGNYTVSPFKIKFINHLKENENDTNGWKTLAKGGDADKVAIVVSTGKSYVNGKAVEKIADSIVELDKARESEPKRGAVIRPVYGNYILAKIDASSNILPRDINTTDNITNDFDVVTLYDASSQSGTHAGTVIGNTRVKGVELYSGVAGDIDAIWKVNVFDVQLNSGSTFNDVRGLFKSDSQTFIANVQADAIDGLYKVYEPNNNVLVYSLPYDNVKSIRDADNNLASNTIITIIKRYVGTVNASGNVVFSTQGNESFTPYSTSKWVAGIRTVSNYTPFDLTGKVTSTPTVITINAGAGEIGNSLVLACEVTVTNASEKTKTLNTEYLTGLPGHSSEYSLTKVDAFRLKRVYNTTTNKDITDNYVLNVNTHDNYYGISTISIKPGITLPAPGDLIDVDVDYFQHSDNGYYFSIDSYTSIINDPNTEFTYADVPTYTAMDSTTYRLSDTIDFRPSIGAGDTFDGAGAIIGNIPTSNSNIIFDVNYYLPRVDVLCVGDTGDIFITKGEPSLRPNTPTIADNAMHIYTISLDSYTFDIKVNIRSKFVDNRRYTMHDIGKIDRRLKNVEYYVAFTLLEKQTADQTILDGNGNDRFKNGFMTDAFKDYVASDTKNLEYSVALDTKKGELIPSFSLYNVNLILDEVASSNYVKRGNSITMDYDHVIFNEQPFASKSISVNPYFIYNQIGDITLEPNSDVWKDVTTQPDLVLDIDTGWDGIRDIANEAGMLGTTWDSWRTTNQTTRNTFTRTGNGNWTSPNWIQGFASTTTTTTTRDQVRTGLSRRIESQVSNFSLGETVTSVNIIPYMRSIRIRFAATGLTPNTILHTFFDGVNVDDDVRRMNSATNEPLITDDNGDVLGVFTIPNRDSKRFFTGSRIFRLTNSVTDSTDPDELVTSAETTFFAGGISETRRETILSVETPVLRTSSFTQNRVLTTTRRRRNWTPTRDPLAQSFIVSEVNGVFLSKLNVYFNAKSNTTPVWAKLVPMENGIPTQTVIPFSEVWLKPDKVVVSSDSSLPTTFEFEAPVYLKGDTEYAFVVGSDDKDYRVFVSKLGGTTLGDDPVTISSQPHMGSLFKSQNDRTWTPEQYEDIKFQLFKAKFNTSSPMNLVYKNEDDAGRAILHPNPLESESGSRYIRVHNISHAMVANDKVRIEMLTGSKYTLEVASGNLINGQTLIGKTVGAITSTAEVNEIKLIGSGVNGHKIYEVTLNNLIGSFETSDTFSGNVYYESFNTDDIYKKYDITKNDIIHSTVTGVIQSGASATFNGIPLTDITNVAHLVQYVDSLDSYVIQLDTPATATGRFGGTDIYVNSNIKADTVMLNNKFIDFNGESSWSMDAISHATLGGVGNNYAPIENINLISNNNITLDSPIKVATGINELSLLGAGNKSITITGTLPSDDENLSPVVNNATASLTTISNRIAYSNSAIANVAPNATDRWVDESDTFNGSETCKYITQSINLNNPASGLSIYFDVLKFLDSDVQVWYRTIPTELEKNIDEMTWVNTGFNNDVVSSDDTDFKPVELQIPEDNSQVLPDFKSVQIKVVLKTKNSAHPPKLKSFRLIAVT